MNVNGMDLLTSDDDDLAQCGIQFRPHRLRLLEHIKRLAGEGVAPELLLPGKVSKTVAKDSGQIGMAGPKSTHSEKQMKFSLVKHLLTFICLCILRHMVIQEVLLHRQHHRPFIMSRALLSSKL